MSDQRIALPVRISDPTTPSQQVAVDSSGRITAIVIGNKTNNNAAPGATNVGTLPALANGAAPTWTEGDQVTLSVDLAGNLRVSSTGLADESTFTEGTTLFTPIGGEYNTSPTALTSGHAGACQVTSKRGLHVNLRDSSGNEISTSSNPQFVQGAKTNNNAAPGATNVGTLPALANAAAPSWTEGNQVALSTDLAGNLRVTPIETALASPSNDNQTSASLAAGSSVTLSSATIATASFLYGVDLACSVPFKAVVQKVENGGAAVIFSTLFGEAGNSIQWRPPDKAFTKIATHTTGTNNYEVVFTNLDPSQAADVYAQFSYAQS